METPASNPKVVARIGLDWADQCHEICLKAADSPPIKLPTVDEKPEVLQGWVELALEQLISLLWFGPF
jgi:hypothetical protein